MIMVLGFLEAAYEFFTRDQLNGRWHRHLPGAPDLHDTSEAGSTPVSLPEFLDEVEMILAEKGLP
jgi:hypothetical protein